MFRSYLLALPVHAGCLSVKDLHAVHSHISLAGLGIARYYAWKGDEFSGVLRPTLQNREVSERKIGLSNDLFAGAGIDSLGEELPHFRQHGQHFHFVEKAL